MIIKQGSGHSNVDAGRTIRRLALVPFTQDTLAGNVESSLTSFLFLPEHYESDSVILLSMIPQFSVFPEV